MPTLDCAQFERLADRYLTNDLPSDLRSPMSQHLAYCSRCSDLMLILDGQLTDRVPAPPPDLTRRILDTTTGPGCSGIESRLCDYADGVLPVASAVELELHLARCADCSAIVQKLRELNELLPALASPQLDAGFAGSVLDRTTRAMPKAPNWITKLRSGFELLLLRPRFGLEAAFVGSLLFFTVTAVPAGSFQDGPEFAVSLFRDGIRKATLPTPIPMPDAIVSKYNQARQAVSNHAESARTSFEETLVLIQDERAAAEEYSASVYVSVKVRVSEFPSQAAAYFEELVASD